MYEIDFENILIQSLTQYLQYFKTNFILTLQLIQHFQPSPTSKSIVNNYQSVISKITQKKTHPQFQLSPFLLFITQSNKSYIDRFYMRIVQYLQYRLANIFQFNTQIKQKMIAIKNTFMNSLHKVFKSIVIIDQHDQKQKHINIGSSSSIGSLFYQIEQSVKNFFISMFNNLHKFYIKDPLVIQQLTLSKTTIQTHLIKPFYQYLRSFLIGQTPTLKGNQYLSDFRSHYRSKSQFNIESFSLINSKSIRQSLRDKQFYSNNSRLYSNNNKTQIRKNHQQYHQQYSLYQQKNYLLSQNTLHNNKKSSYADMLSIMQIQNIQVYSSEYIMKQLKQKNMKNKLIINKFLKVYKKKQKKHKHKINNHLQKHLKQQSYTDDIDNILSKSLEPQTVRCSLIKQDQGVIQKEEINKKQVNFYDIQSNQNPYNVKDKIIAICITGSKQPQQQSIQSEQHIQPLITAHSKSLVQKLTPKPKTQSKHLTLINPIISNHSQLQSLKQTFLYKQKQKLYFQQLKHKMNFHFQQKTTSSSTPIQVKKDIQIQTLKQLNKIQGNNHNKFLIQQFRQKKSQRNLNKRTTVKGSNISSFLIINEQRKNNSKSCHSNSQILNKNQLISLGNINNGNNLQTLSVVQGSGLNKLMSKQRNIKNIKQQNMPIREDNRIEQMIKSEQKIKKSVQFQSTVVVLPRIVNLTKKKIARI